MIRIAVCDDEESSLQNIREMLADYRTIPVTADYFRSGEELLAAWQGYDLVLLDIDMGGIDGIETARRIRELDKKVKLFYITSYSEYSIFAFAVHAFSYLLKPVDREEFYRQLDEAVNYGIEKQEKELEFLAKEGIVRILPSQITYFEYLSREVILHCEKGEFHLKMRMTDVSETMKAYDFEAPHKSFLVNLYGVSHIHGYEVYMTDGSRVPLSQKRSVEFRRSLNAYLAGRREAIR